MEGRADGGIGQEQRQQVREAEKDVSESRAALRQQAAAITAGQTVTAQALAEMDTAIDVANRSSQRAVNSINQTVERLEAMVKANPNAENTDAYKQAYDEAIQNKKKVEDLQKTVRELRRRKAELEGKKTIKRKKGTISYAGGTVEGVKYDSVDPEKLTRQQKKVAAMVESLADAVNLDYVFISAEPGMGGAYVKGGTVFVNINAGMGVDGFSQTMAAASLSHELTHWMQDYAPEQYRELKDFIISEVLKADPQELRRLVEQQRRWEQGRSLSYEQALDEVVANACQTMLLDSKAITKLARQNMNLAARIADYIEDWTNKIKDAFAEVDTTKGAIYDSLRAVEGSLEHIQELWDNGIEAAAANYNAEKTVQEARGEASVARAEASTEANENAAQNIGGEQLQAWDSDTEYDFGVNQRQINKYIEDAYNAENRAEYRKWSAAEPRLIEDVKDEIPDIAEYSHAIRDNDVRHVRNSHGEQTNEKYPVTKDDQKLIPYIVRNYDKVFVKYRNGKPGLVYVKVMSDKYIYYLESVTDEYNGEKLLVNKQMIKTGIGDIPNLGGLKDAIKKKQALSEFLADLEEVRKAYARSAYQDGTVSDNSITDTAPERKTKMQTWEEEGLIYNGRAVVSEETVDRWLKDYAASNPKYAQAYIAYMSPLDYLQMTTGSYSSRQLIRNQAEGLSVEHALDFSKEQPIQLMIDSSTGKVEGHEGRHRMVSLERAGIDEVPVLMFDSRNKYSKTPMEAITLTGQDFNGNENTRTAVVSDVQPLSRENRDTVLQKFSKKSAYEKIGERYGRKTAQFQRWDNTDGDTAAEANGREQTLCGVAQEKCTGLPFAPLPLTAGDPVVMLLTATRKTARTGDNIK